MSDNDQPGISNLPPYGKRTFVPEEADLTDRDTIRSLYERLQQRNVTDPDQLVQWLRDRSELEAAIDEKGSILYIGMTCQTDDQQRADAYRSFVENIQPLLKTLSDGLDRRYLQLRENIELPPLRYNVHDRSLRTDTDLFRKENISLQTTESLLSQEYQSVCGAMTVDFQGKQRTLQEMGKFLLDPSRDLRHDAWEATAQRRLQDRDRLEDIFGQMLELRQEIAANAGFDGYEEYKFKAYHRFDYTPADCQAYHDAVENCVRPLWEKILRQRKERMKLDRLRPWDTAVDPDGRNPLRPFDHVDELVHGVSRIFHRLDDELAGQFDQMRDLGLLDLDSRKGKAPGGYQSTLNEARKPFIFMNAVGVDRNVRTLLHESGHAFHALACAHDPLLSYRHAPMEFCEVASMSMELLADGLLDEFYQGEDLVRSRREHLEGIIMILPWVATIDAFQHWIYANPDHSPEQRRQAWVNTLDRFSGGVVDWSGLEEAKSYRWHAQLHIFEVPFYYIEYGIAQLGALQIWARARQDADAALRDYKAALALGGARPLPELFDAAGIRFDFSEQTIGPLIEAVEQELNRLEA